MGVTKTTITEGNGSTFPVKGDKLKMHYIGTLAKDGSKFDSSRDRGKMFEFTIGVGQVIKGWDEGVVQMSLGERATLHITSDFGYGARGAGDDIPPGADLVFDVELFAIGTKKAFHTQEEKDKFTKQMGEWMEKQTAKYDTDEEFRNKKNEKHTDREGFVAHLEKTVQDDVAAGENRPTIFVL